MAKLQDGAIGIFDSGVGGLSVLRHVQQLLPQETILYLADQAHVPYGPRPADEVRRFSEGVVDFFLARGVKLVVVACNAASAAALDHLRQAFPNLPIVGMEPAVKPAVSESKSGRIGILATSGTFDSRRYAVLMTRFARDVEVFEDPCPGLVEQIENGWFAGEETQRILEGALSPMLEARIDILVLGCTHYPFVMPVIRRLVGDGVQIIDPAPAVARQVRRVLEDRGLTTEASGPGDLHLFTTGVPFKLEAIARALLSVNAPVEQLIWQGPELSLSD